MWPSAHTPFNMLKPCRIAELCTQEARVFTIKTFESSDLSAHHYRFRKEGIAKSEDEVEQEMRDLDEEVNMYYPDEDDLV